MQYILFIYICICIYFVSRIKRVCKTEGFSMLKSIYLSTNFLRLHPRGRSRQVNNIAGATMATHAPLKASPASYRQPFTNEASTTICEGREYTLHGM